MIFQIVPLFQARSGGEVFPAIDLKGDGQRPVQGVVALVARGAARPWCLIADHPDNEGVSATNGYSDFAAAVCRLLGLKLDDVTWFELDSMGRFDAWTPYGEARTDAGFAAIIEPPHEPSSHGAFLARLDKLGLRHDGVRMMLDNLRKPFLAHDGMHLN